VIILPSNMYHVSTAGCTSRPLSGFNRFMKSKWGYNYYCKGLFCKTFNLRSWYLTEHHTTTAQERWRNISAIPINIVAFLQLNLGVLKTPPPAMVRQTQRSPMQCDRRHHYDQSRLQPLPCLHRVTGACCKDAAENRAICQ